MQYFAERISGGWVQSYHAMAHMKNMQEPLVRAPPRWYLYLSPAMLVTGVTLEEVALNAVLL